jgi:hypothetical protein
MKSAIGLWLGWLVLAGIVPARAQQAPAAGPMAALTEALSAACRQDTRAFGRYLLPSSAAAYRALPEAEQRALLQRFSLTNRPGRPLLSGGLSSTTVLRCEAPGNTVEFRFEAPQMYDNLAFIPAEVVDGEKTQFGLARQESSWRLLSLGLLLLDIPQLEKRWAQQKLGEHEMVAVQDLDQLADAIRSYQKAFGKLPESLAELGPAPPNQVSPEAAELVDKDLALGEKDGYRFRYRILPEPNSAAPSFELAATPAEYGKTGRQSFFLDADGKLHGADKAGAVATADDPVIEGRPAPSAESPAGPGQ